MDHSHTYVVSTVGTSLLTNGADPEMAALLKRTANTGEQEYTQGDLSRVRQRVDSVLQRIEGAGRNEVRAMSAELNGIIGMEAAGPEYSHYRLHTDTYQGEQAARAATRYLERRDCRFAVSCKMEGLTTASQESFSRGIDNLLRWCDQTLPALRQQQARVVFNLSGSFKSLQAYAQTIGMIYADEIWYVFKAPGSPILRVPRLPVRFDDAALREHAGMFARLASGEIMKLPDLPPIPEAYIERDEEHAALSLWGKLAWNTNKRDLLSDRLHEQPGLRIGRSFIDDWDRCADPGTRVDLQETLARTAVLWNEGGLGRLRADGGLQYSDMAGHAGIGHFRLTQGMRVSCAHGAGDLLLRHFGPHDYVNRSP